MMRCRTLIAFAGAALFTALPACGAPVCTLSKRAELPVTMNGLRPLVHATINGTDAQFIADSGAFYSMLTPAMAEQFRLPLKTAPFGISVAGVGGEASRTWVTTVHNFGIFTVNIPDVEFLVAGNDFGRAAGLLGQNVLRLAGDVEYDLANGMIRLMTPKDCGKSALAYWAGSQSFSVLDIDRATREAPHTRAVAYLNGQKIQVIFDTGAAASVLTLDAAKRAGMTPSSPGAVPSGAMYGVGTRVSQSWVAPFASFKIGDEEIRNARLRFGSAGIRGVDMLLGSDFFLSHRVYVANGQQKLYFTYNGGPVFNLTANPASSATNSQANPPAPRTDADSAASGSQGTDTAKAAAPADAATDAPAAALADLPQLPPDQPSDAAGFSRRGAAYASRHDFAHAIADLTRACELSPNEASYFYQRGLAYLDNNQPGLALADFDQALKLRPNDLAMLLSRAALNIRKGERAAVIADLDAASRIAAREDTAHVPLGHMYLHMTLPVQADAQFTAWIETHSRSDVQMPHVVAARCWARAVSGTIPDAALSDCDSALRSLPEDEEALLGRGLIRLRNGDYDKAMVDLERAMSLQPRNSWAQYGRGVARLRKGRTTDGQADIAAAKSRDASIAERASRIGITP